jgi:hypothetical protein
VVVYGKGVFLVAVVELDGVGIGNILDDVEVHPPDRRGDLGLELTVGESGEIGGNHEPWGAICIYRTDSELDIAGIDVLVEVELPDAHFPGKAVLQTKGCNLLHKMSLGNAPEVGDNFIRQHHATGTSQDT